jgi:hypothetical protein
MTSPRLTAARRLGASCQALQEEDGEENWDCWEGRDHCAFHVSLWPQDFFGLLKWPHPTARECHKSGNFFAWFAANQQLLLLLLLLLFLLY